MIEVVLPVGTFLFGMAVGMVLLALWIMTDAGRW